MSADPSWSATRRQEAPASGATPSRAPQHTPDCNNADGCRVTRRNLIMEVGIMPRETVVQSQPAASPPANAAGTPHPSGHVEPRHGLSVGWNKIGWVQIHMVPDQWESTGDWTIVDLERQDINRLIRTLRKARDQAFGADA